MSPIEGLPLQNLAGLAHNMLTATDRVVPRSTSPVETRQQTPTSNNGSPSGEQPISSTEMDMLGEMSAAQTGRTTQRPAVPTSPRLDPLYTHSQHEQQEHTSIQRAEVWEHTGSPTVTGQQSAVASSCIEAPSWSGAVCSTSTGSSSTISPITDRDRWQSSRMNPLGPSNATQSSQLVFTQQSTSTHPFSLVAATPLGSEDNRKDRTPVVPEEAPGGFPEASEPGSSSTDSQKRQDLLTGIYSSLIAESRAARQNHQEQPLMASPQQCFEPAHLGASSSLHVSCDGGLGGDSLAPAALRFLLHDQSVIRDCQSIPRARFASSGLSPIGRPPFASPPAAVTYEQSSSAKRDDGRYH